LETTGQEMKRRAEETISAWTEQVRTVESVTGQEIDRFTNHLKTELNRRLESTNETLKNIEAATMAAQESLQSTQENLSKVSEQVMESANGRMHAFVQDLVANAERQMEESGRAATAKWISQLEDKATDTTYTAFGSLFKVSEWCEKKAQMRMQSALEKGLNAASDNVREKAENALQEFSAKAEAASGEISKVIEEGRAQIRANSESEGEQLLSRLRTAFTEDAQATLNRASQDLLNQVSNVLETVRAETLERENRLREAVTQLGEQAIQAHELRLDQISHSSLQETISKFSHESNEVLETMSRSAEERLRYTCNQVFNEAGEALRQRLLELTFMRPAAKAATDSA
jgi:F0F1-type ATP synthase membrane subunit b/b'